MLGQYPTDQFPFAILILTPHQPLKLILLSNSDATQADSHFDAFQHRFWPLNRFDNLNMQIALRSRKFVFRFGFLFVMFVFRFVSVISLRGFASRAIRVTTHATRDSPKDNQLTVIVSSKHKQMFGPTTGGIFGVNQDPVYHIRARDL